MLGLALAAVLGVSDDNGRAPEIVPNQPQPELSRVRASFHTLDEYDSGLVRQLAKLEDSQGQLLFDEMMLRHYLNAGGTLEEARGLSALVDREGDTLFDSYDIFYFVRQGYNLKDAQALAALTAHDGRIIFERDYSIINFLEDYSDPELARELVAVTDARGQSIFDEADGLLRYLEHGGTIELAKGLSSITDSERETIFDSDTLMWLYAETNGTIKQARELALITDSSGRTALSGWDIIDVIKYNLGHDLIAELAQMTDDEGENEGENIFTGGEIVDFLQAGGTREYAQALISQSQSLRGREITTFLRLGLEADSVNTFEDTERPNALVVYSTDDLFGALYYSTYFDPVPPIAAFGPIWLNYDYRIVFVKEEGQVYQAITETPNLELLVIGGHGTRTSSTLGMFPTQTTDKDLVYYSARFETASFGFEDGELSKYLSLLEPNAVIFLFSCSNGKGGVYDGNNVPVKNYANFVAQRAGGRTVIASTAPFGADNIQITNAYPLELRIVVTLPGQQPEDRTYIFPPEE